MKFTACDCRAAHYQRVKRSPWMKVVPGRRLFHCHACDRMLLLDPSDVQLRVRKEETVASRAVRGDMALRA
jgi:hypothetical protein